MRRTKGKKFIAAVLACIVLLMNAVTVMAEEVDETVSGQEILENEDAMQESVDEDVELKAEDGYGLLGYSINCNAKYYIYNRALDLFLTNKGNYISGEQFTGNEDQIWIIEDEQDDYELRCKIKSAKDGNYIIWDDTSFIAKLGKETQQKDICELYSVYYDFLETGNDGKTTGYINAALIAPWSKSPAQSYPPVAGINGNLLSIVGYCHEYVSDDDWGYPVIDNLQVFEFIDASTYHNTKVSTSQNAGVEEFVSRMYTVALNRESETEGLNDWVGQLRNHTIDGAGIANGFINSREFLNKKLSNDDFVKVLYATFFDREPDTAGMQDWVTKLNAGVSRTEVLSGFVNSEEFSNLCDTFGIARGTMQMDGTSRYNIGVRNFCERMYTKALDRSGETMGIEYWANLINTGAVQPKDVAKSFFNSQEFLNRNLCDADFVDVLYQTFMGRPSELDGKIYWIQKLHHGGMTREQVVESFAASQEFSNIMAEYGF